MKLDDQVWLLGIRHHGPGCASSLKQALAAIQPDAILLEGAQELGDSWRLCGAPGMEPPVAQLVYDLQDPARALFYPWGLFSPEWQAMQYALKADCALEMMDLPAGIAFAQRAQVDEEAPSPDEEGMSDPEEFATPMDRLAEAAGFRDGESWWDQQVEQTRGGAALFSAIGEAMMALRQQEATEVGEREGLREAWMRRVLRKARKQYDRIAVVCGAWHVPALAARVRVAEDNARLKGWKKRRVAVAWVPYTYERFSQQSGYGAGIRSPGWYEHLFRHHEAGSDGDTLLIDWMTRIAQLLREEGFLCSSAEVIEGVRLAKALAALRGQAMPGLDETLEAARSVMTQGRSGPLSLIARKLILSDRLGRLPDTVPKLPLEQDLEARARRLRLTRSETERTLELDLRKDMGLQRSILLHRLTLLGIPWGECLGSEGLGTFKETWLLQWRPECSLALIDASVLGNTIEVAATKRFLERLAGEPRVSGVARLLEVIQMADLASAVPPTSARLRELAALSGDIQDLMESLFSLVQVSRYGSVRGLGGDALAPILEGILIRVTNGLASACVQRDEEAAYQMLQAIDQTHTAIHMRESEADRARWIQALAEVADQDRCHPVILGRVARMRYDLGELSPDALSRAVRLALSEGNAVESAAAWIEGLLFQSATLLLYDDRLFSLLDTWVQALDEADFLRILPLMRRTCSSFSSQELMQLGRRVRVGTAQTAAITGRIDPRLWTRALARLQPLLGEAP